jgi:hypothetical protein
MGVIKTLVWTIVCLLQKEYETWLRGNFTAIFWKPLLKARKRLVYFV